MQRTSAALRLPTQGLVVARVAVVALIALVLVVVGCTAAQSATSAGSSSQAVTVHAATLKVTALETAALQTTALGEVTSAQRLLACIPGRDKTRVETNALSPSSAVLHHCPAGTWVRTAVHFGTEGNTSQRAGRTPAALTHLDLGIFRT